MLTYYNPIESNEFLFYKIEKMSLKKHPKKKYKNLNNKIKEPVPVLLLKEVDREYKPPKEDIKPKTTPITDPK